MKLNAVRASLAAVLTATLLISLLPVAFAHSTVSWTQQTASSKARRGKNGELIKTLAGQELPLAPSSGTEPNPESSKAVSGAQPNREPAATGETLQSADPLAAKADDPRQFAAALDTGPPDGASQSQSKREPPPFDRPPLRTGRQNGSDSSDRSADSSSQTGSRPTNPGADSTSRGDSRGSSGSQRSTSADGQRGRSSDPSSAGSADPERTTGAPPVLQRPADGRSQGDGAAQRPPVLRRPTDAQEAPPDGATPRTPGSGQQQGGEGPDDVVKLESTLVNLPLLVSDRSGRYIPQLSGRDFSLYEDGVQQTIASFGSEEVPFSVVLMLDVSPSVQGNVEDIQDAAIAFVRQLRSQDRVMVVSFDRRIHYLSDFTNDRRELEGAIRQANTGSGTSVYDAVFEVVQRRLRNIEGRKALILFSDGEDTTSSRAEYDDAINAVTESDVLVYGLRYPGSGGRGGVRVDPWPRSPIPGIQLPFPFPWPFPRRRRGPFRLTDPTSGQNNAATTSPQWSRRGTRGGGDFMADITTAGGGPVYDAEKISDLGRLANRIAEELRHVYVISYYPTNPLSKGGYRSVRVSVKGRDDIAVRHRRGYNARPNGSAKSTI